MLKRFFEGRSTFLKNVKIFLLSLLCVNAIFSMVVLAQMLSNKNNIFPYLGIDVKISEPTNDNFNLMFGKFVCEFSAPKGFKI